MVVVERCATVIALLAGTSFVDHLRNELPVLAL